MARLQDFPTVTPTSSDKLLVVQSQGQGLVPYGSKLDSANPTGTGSLSLNRKANTTTGDRSATVGADNTASGSLSFAEGYATTASGNYGSHSEGRETEASGEAAHSQGYLSKAKGNVSSACGVGTIANRRSQHAFGEYNVEETGSIATKGTYIELVGNGTSNARSNARTLDWNGNETLAGDLTIMGNKSVNDAITVTNGDITSSDYTGHIYWKKQGNVVILNFYDFKISTSSVSISALLPSEIRPTGTNARGMILSVDATAFGSIHVTTGGNFEAVVTNTSKYYYGNVAYII